MTGGLPSESFRTTMVERGSACAGATDVGPVRHRNEDAFWISADASVLVVADGLGGLPGGDMASLLAVGAVAGHFDGGLLAAAARAGSGDLASLDLESLALEAAAHAQNAVLAAASRNPQLRGMATTLVLVLVHGRDALVLHIGDSRAGLWRDGGFVAMTFDHNGVGDLVRAGALTQEQARHHPSRNLVREVVGLPEGYRPECQQWTLAPGDILMLCTDGVSDAMPEDRMAGVLSSSVDAAVAAASLVEVAGLEGGHDNATAIVLQVT